MTYPRSGALTALIAMSPGLLGVIYCVSWFRLHPSPTTEEYIRHCGWLAVIAGLIGGAWMIFMLIGLLIELTPSHPPRRAQATRPIGTRRLRPGFEQTFDLLARPFALGLALSCLLLSVLFSLTWFLVVPTIVIVLAGIPLAGLTIIGLMGVAGSK